MKGRHGRSRRDVRVRLLLLAAGQEVEVPCRLRRTSARGWGPWTDGVLLLAQRGDHRAEWRVTDGLAVGLTPSKAGQAFPVADVVNVAIRTARFREEAFHGPGTEILVVTADRSVTEFCVPAEEVAEVFHRLDAVAGDPAADPPDQRPSPDLSEPS